MRFAFLGRLSTASSDSRGIDDKCEQAQPSDAQTGQGLRLDADQLIMKIKDLEESLVGDLSSEWQLDSFAINLDSRFAELR